MWDLENERNKIDFRDGISGYKQTLTFGQFLIFFFPQNAFKSSEMSAGGGDSGQVDSSHEKTRRQPNKDRANEPFIGARRVSYSSNVKILYTQENIKTYRYWLNDFS